MNTGRRRWRGSAGRRFNEHLVEEDGPLVRERLGSLRSEPNEDEGRGETIIGILCTQCQGKVGEQTNELLA